MRPDVCVASMACRQLARVTTASWLLLKHARRSQPALRVSIVAVWSDALSTFSAHSLAILPFALIGFAAPAILGSLLHTSAKLSEYGRTHAVVTLYDKPSLTVLLVQASLGILTLTFARGAITWLALHDKRCCEDGRSHGNFGEACRTTLVRYPALLVGLLLYSTLITVGVVMMSAFTQKLEFVPSKMAHVWAGSHRAFGDALRQLAWRGFNSLMPDLGSPFAEFIPNLSDAISKHTTRVIYHERSVDGSAWPIVVAEVTSETAFVSAGMEVIKPHRNPLTVVAGVALMVIAETLLRLRIVMAMTPPMPPKPRRFEWLRPLADCTHFGPRYFGTITVHTWFVRLVIFALTLTLIELPVALMDHFLVPHVMRLGGSFEILPILRFLATASAALVNAILLALSVVYDAQLFKQLTPSQSTPYATASITWPTYGQRSNVEHYTCGVSTSPGAVSAASTSSSPGAGAASLKWARRS